MRFQRCFTISSDAIGALQKSFQHSTPHSAYDGSSWIHQFFLRKVNRHWTWKKLPWEMTKEHYHLLNMVDFPLSSYFRGVKKVSLHFFGGEIPSGHLFNAGAVFCGSYTNLEVICMPYQRIFAKPSLVDRVWLYTSVSRLGWRNFGNPRTETALYKVFSTSKFGTTWILWWKWMWMILHDDLALNCLLQMVLVACFMFGVSCSSLKDFRCIFESWGFTRLLFWEETCDDCLFPEQVLRGGNICNDVKLLETACCFMCLHFLLNIWISIIYTQKNHIDTRGI